MENPYAPILTLNLEMCHHGVYYGVYCGVYKSSSPSRLSGDPDMGAITVLTLALVLIITTTPNAAKLNWVT